jgi:Dolichyl-phosphate-mannose-protein mannosyltransferase
MADVRVKQPPVGSMRRSRGAHARSSTRVWTTPGGAVLLLVLVVLAITGVFLRLWLVHNASTNADEATAGLIAHQITLGHTYAFYWGQSYGGVEPYGLAIAFSLFGQSPFVLNATPAVLALVGTVIVWRIGLHLFAAPAASVAAVLGWIWSESTLWNSTKEYGFHELALVLGLVVLLQSVRMIQRAHRDEGDRVIDWAFLGGAVGLGFWASPEIAYFAIPGLVFVVTTLRGRTSRAARLRCFVLCVTAFVGALPWIWATVKSHGAGIPASPVSYLSRLSTFFSHVLPMILGLRVEGAGAWEGGRLFGLAAYALLLVLVIGGAVVLAVRVPDARVLVLTLTLFPFLYAAFPTSWFWNDGRYAIALTPLLSLMITGACWQLFRPRVAAWLSCALLVAALASTLIAFNDATGAIAKPSELTTFSADPNSLVTSLSDHLERDGVAHAYAGYWVANDLSFISDNRVTALALGVSRNPPEATNAGNVAVAWIFVPTSSVPMDSAQLESVSNLEPGSITEGALTGWLHDHKVSYRTLSTSGFEVIVPGRNIDPVEIQG